MHGREHHNIVKQLASSYTDLVKRQILIQRTGVDLEILHL